MAIARMSGREFAKALDRLGFNNRGFCIWLGVAERSGRDWKSGATPIPPALAAFLRLAIAMKLDGERLRKLLGE